MERLIDADEVYKVLTDYYNHKTEIQHKALKEAIGRVPSIDAVEVVRCKDCKWRGELGCAVSIVDESDIPDDDDYCSWGERREDDNH